MCARPVLLAMLLSSGAWAQAAKVEVTLEAREQVQYQLRWGGAAPKREDLELVRRLNAQAKPVPLVSRRLLIRPGPTNRDVEPIEVVTDGHGLAKVELRPGTWCVVEESKRQVEDPAGVVPAHSDPECLRQLRARCDAVLTVKDAREQRYQVTIVRTQGGGPPCWNGPTPPSRPTKNPRG